jgi:glutamate racemase
MPAERAAPIGVFDSGVGGLTVLRALQSELPQEQFIYLGDTARLPYGTKSADTVERYALQAAKALIERRVKALVIACNTASAVALPAMAARYGDIPLIGVVHPGADAAVAATRSGHIAVIGTEATVRGGAYQRAILTRRPDARISAVACQLFVALAEEGWTEGPVACAVAERYLGALFGRDARGAADAADTLVLGCTHFPMLRQTLRAVIGEQVAIVDSAATTAVTAHALLRQRGLVNGGERPPAAAVPLRLLATDSAARFATVGARFLGRPIAAHEVELIDL